MNSSYLFFLHSLNRRGKQKRVRERTVQNSPPPTHGNMTRNNGNQSIDLCLCCALGTITPANRSNTLRIMCGWLDWFKSVSFQRHWEIRFGYWNRVELYLYWLAANFIEVEKESCKMHAHAIHMCSVQLNDEWACSVYKTLVPNLHTNTTKEVAHIFVDYVCSSSNNF